LADRLTRHRGIPVPHPIPRNAARGPARAVVAPPHLPAKTNSFYAGMHRLLRAGQYRPRGDRRGSFVVQFYAP
jgi:hypothetical protein